MIIVGHRTVVHIREHTPSFPHRTPTRTPRSVLGVDQGSARMTEPALMCEAVIDDRDGLLGGR